MHNEWDKKTDITGFLGLELPEIMEWHKRKVICASKRESNNFIDYQRTVSILEDTRNSTDLEKDMLTLEIVVILDNGDTTIVKTVALSRDEMIYVLLEKEWI